MRTNEPLEQGHENAAPRAFNERNYLSTHIIRSLEKQYNQRVTKLEEKKYDSLPDFAEDRGEANSFVNVQIFP